MVSGRAFLTSPMVDFIIDEVRVTLGLDPMSDATWVVSLEPEDPGGAEGVGNGRWIFPQVRGPGIEGRISCGHLGCYLTHGRHMVRCRVRIVCCFIIGCHGGLSLWRKVVSSVVLVKY